MTKASNDKYIRISVISNDISTSVTPWVFVASPLVQGTEIDTGGRAPFATSTCQIIVEALKIVRFFEKGPEKNPGPESKTELK